jgi:type IV secretion system protein VirD4
MSTAGRATLLTDTHPVELALAAALAAAAGFAAFGWLVAQTAAAFTGHHPPPLSLPAGLSGVLAWRHHPADPRLGFPVPVRGVLSGPVEMYAAVVADTAAITVATLVAARLTKRIRAGNRPGYATATEIRRDLSRRSAGRRGPASGSGIVVALGTDIRTHQQLYGAAEDSYLYLGPPRSGKSVHLVIPQTLDAPGAALVTETRPDVLSHTLALRARHGPVAVFDPQHVAGEHVPRLRWAPQHGCADPLTAIVRARALGVDAELNPATVSDANYWRGMTEAVLRCYLHAAALDGRTMRDVLAWTARPGDPTPLRILRTHPAAAPGWAEELATQVTAHDRQRDAVWGAVRRSLDSLADPRVLDTCSPRPDEALDLVEFVRSRGTLYLLGSTDIQLTVAPLIAALVEALLGTARTLGAATAGGRLDPPLTVLLDEAANIAPIPSLPNLLADGGGSGITTICVLQSLAQARARWGQAGADAMWDAATTKVVFGGLAEAEDLQRISQLAGEIDDPVHTRTHGAGGSSTSVSPRRLPALPVEVLRTLPEGTAIVFARRTPPVHARLIPWWDGRHARPISQALHSQALTSAVSDRSQREPVPRGGLS